MKTPSFFPPAIRFGALLFPVTICLGAVVLLLGCSTQFDNGQGTIGQGLVEQGTMSSATQTEPSRAAILNPVAYAQQRAATQTPEERQRDEDAMYWFTHPAELAAAWRAQRTPEELQEHAAAVEAVLNPRAHAAAMERLKTPAQRALEAEAWAQMPGPMLRQPTSGQ